MEKLYKLLLVFFVGTLSIACSSDDNADIGGNNDGPIIPQLGYFPQNVGNSWTYDIQSEDFSEQDHLYRSEEHTSEPQSRENIVCRLLLEKKKPKKMTRIRRS